MRRTWCYGAAWRKPTGTWRGTVKQVLSLWQVQMQSDLQIDKAPAFLALREDYEVLHCASGEHSVVKKGA